MKLYSQKNYKFFLYAALFLVGSLSLITYLPGLHGPFVFDDGPNIFENQALHISSLDKQELIDAVTAVKAGPLGRPVSYLSFALNYYFFGDDVFSFKLTNVLIHILNGLSIFVFTGLLLRAYRFAYRSNITKPQIQWVALLVSTIWLLHPIAVTSVLYIVQRMTSIASLFTFISLSFYISGRLRQIVGRSAYIQFVLGFFIFFPLAVLSKENAALIPIFVVLIEVSVFKPITRMRNQKRLLFSLLVITLISILGIYLQYDRLIAWLHRSYELRPFTLSERLLTEPRVIWFYIKLIFLPRPSELGLYHDDIPLSTNLLTPHTTLISLGALFGLVISAISLRTKAPVFSFGILFFLIGHSIESSFIPLEIAHEHRNYLPMFGLLLIIGYYSAHPTVLKKYRTAVISGLLILVSMYAMVTAQRASQWSNEAQLIFSLTHYHPKSARSNYEAGRILTNLVELKPENPVNSQKYYRLAREYFTLAYKTDRSNHSGLFGILYLDSLLGNPIESTIIGELKVRLSQQAILPATVIAFTNIHQCWIEDRCTMDPAVLTDLYRTALKNTLMTTKSRASLLSEVAIAELRLGKAELALSLFRQAVDTSPDKPQFWFNFIQVLISAGKFEQARTHIRHAKKRFPDPKNLQRIAKLETQLIGH